MLDKIPAIDHYIQREHSLLAAARLFHQSTRRLPMSFKTRPYLIELYRDLPTLDACDMRKGVQVGVSELLVAMCLHSAGWKGKTVGYVLPTYAIRDRFVQQRIDPLLGMVPEYRHRAPGGGMMSGVKAAANLKRKRFGNGSMLFLGSNTEGDFIEFSADVLFIDEFDQCDPMNLAKARDRVRESPSPQIIRIGNPTLPRVGVSRLFDESDGRLWHFVCDHCGEWQPIDWEVNVVMRDDNGIWIPRDQERAQDYVRVLSQSEVIVSKDSPDLRPVCRKCAKPFVRTIKGGWVAARPNAGLIRGYSMSRMDVISDRIMGLYKEWMTAQGDSAKISAFYTSVLGKPWENAGMSITIPLLERACVGEPVDHFGGEEYEPLLVTAGIDVGTVVNITVSVIEAGPDETVIRRAVYVGATTSFDDIRDILIRFRVNTAVIDAMPETRKAQELRDYFINVSNDTQVWLCRFSPTPRVGTHKYGWKLDWNSQVVLTDRTQVFDATVEDLQNGVRQFPGDAFTVFGWTQQMCAPKRVVNEEKQRIEWTEGSDPDHYMLTDVYDRIAYDLSQQGGSFFTI